MKDLTVPDWDAPSYVYRVYSPPYMYPFADESHPRQMMKTVIVGKDSLEQRDHAELALMMIEPVQRAIQETTGRLLDVAAFDIVLMDDRGDFPVPIRI